MCNHTLTSALIADTRFITWTRIIAATSNVAHAIVTYLICNAVIITVAYSFTNTAVASFIAQAICITEKNTII